MIHIIYDDARFVTPVLLLLSLGLGGRSVNSDNNGVVSLIRLQSELFLGFELF